MKELLIHVINKIEYVLVWSFVILFGLVIIVQLAITNPFWADLLVLLQQLEGSLYSGGF